jgi:hypothetical protein
MANKLLKDFADEKSKTGAKNSKRVALENLIPQVFAQDKKALKKEIINLQGNLSGMASRSKYGHLSKKGKPQATYNRAGERLKEVEGKSGGSTKPEPIEVLPPITMPLKDVIAIWETVFDKFKNSQEKKFREGKIIGSNKDPITLNDWVELEKVATRLTGYEYICPVPNLTIVNSGLKKKFGDAVADAEIAHRSSSTSKRETDDMERKYVSARITGYQSPKHSLGGKQTLYRNEGLTSAEKSSGIQLGHGDAGMPTFLHIARMAEKEIDESDFTADEKELLKKGIYDSHAAWEATLSSKEKITLRGFKKEYSLLIITGQRTSGNMDDNTVEKVMAAPIRDWWRYIASPGEHKTVLRESIGNLLLGKLTLRNKGVKNTSRRWKPLDRVVSKETSPKIKYTYKEKKRIAIMGGSSGLGLAVKGIKQKAKTVTKNPRRATKASSLGSSPGSPMQALAMFNASLEEAIRDNMGSPALNYQTGRFAESVKVLSITPSIGTSGIIQYAYRKDPYQLYEGDGMRDPRLLIDKTLREQAAELALGKFTTQRV